MTDIQVYSYQSHLPGKKILFFGRIHGDEPCGELALRRLMQQLDSHELALLDGSLTIIPVCNPKATAENKRSCDANLNRVFKKTDTPESYEATLANTLAEHVEQTDLLVDLHSGHTPAYFVFQDYQSPECGELVKASAIPTVITGWPQLYEVTDDMDTVSYAHQHGKPGIVIEGGQHDDAESVERTYEAIINILKHYGMIEGAPAVVSQQIIHMDKTYYKEKEGSLARIFLHGDSIQKGELLATYDDGEKIVAPRASVMILPKNYATSLNAERFYLGHVVE